MDIQPTHDDLIKAAYIGYCQDKAAPDMEFDDFAEYAKHFELFPVTRDNVLYGVLCVLGPTIHACIKPEFYCKWLGKKELKKMKQLIERFGYAETSFYASNSKGREFCLGLGFRFHRQDGDVVFVRKYQ